jgi:membrane dipeptidase
VKLGRPRITHWIVLAAVIAACTSGPPAPGAQAKPAAAKAVAAKPAPEDSAARARRVHRDAIVVDTHCDALDRAVDDGVDLTVRNPEGHVDLPKLKDGGVDAEVFALWADPDEWKGRYAERIDALLAAYDAMIAKSAGGFVRATTAADASRAAREGKVAAFLGLEGGYAVEGYPGGLERLYERGVRYVTLTWWNNTSFADGSGDKPKWHGLTDRGREMVRELNRLGMLVDVSHASEETFYDALETTTAPLIASHSGARAIADHHRNLTDDQLRALAKNGGVVGIDYVAGFLDAETGRRSDALRELLKPRFAEIDKRFKKQPGKAREARWDLFNEEAKKSLPPVPFSRLIDHIEHAARVAGPEHVGLGSDFDGFALGVEGMNGAADVPRITEALLSRGMSEKDVTGILGGNFLRVFRQVLDAAQRPGAPDAGPGAR